MPYDWTGKPIDLPEDPCPKWPWVIIIALTIAGIIFIVKDSML